MNDEPDDFEASTVSARAYLDAMAEVKRLRADNARLRSAMVSDEMRLIAAAAYWEAYRDAWRPLALLPKRFDVPFAGLPNRHAREATLSAIGQSIEAVAPAIRAAAMEEAVQIAIDMGAEEEANTHDPRALDIARVRQDMAFEIASALETKAAAIRAAKETA